jgi:hypothetical protein
MKIQLNSNLLNKKRRERERELANRFMNIYSLCKNLIKKIELQKYSEI